jgi:hypothetical protein
VRHLVAYVLDDLGSGALPGNGPSAFEVGRVESFASPVFQRGGANGSSSIGHRALPEKYETTEPVEALESFFGRHVFLRGLLQFFLSLMFMVLVLVSVLCSFLFSQAILYPASGSVIPSYFMDSFLLLLPMTIQMTGYALMLWCILVKWLLIGCYKSGRYPLWGSFFFRWWFTDHLMRLVPLFAMSSLFYDSPFGKLWYWFLGARISWFVHLKGQLLEPDLVAMGAGSGTEATLSCSILQPTYLDLWPLKKGPGLVSTAW